MPDITLCENKECLLRDNCKRGLVYNDNKTNQSWAYFEPELDFIWDAKTWSIQNKVKCEFQIEIN